MRTMTEDMMRGSKLFTATFTKDGEQQEVTVLAKTKGEVRAIVAQQYSLAIADVEVSIRWYSGPMIIR